MGYRMVTLQPLLSSCKMCINVKSVGQGKIKFYAKIVRWFSLRKDLQTVLRWVCVCDAVRWKEDAAQVRTYPMQFEFGVRHAS